MKKEENTIELKNFDQENTKILGVQDNGIEPDTIVFNIGDEEKIKITEEGFFVEGRLVENDKEIYQQFKSFIEKGLA